MTSGPSPSSLRRARKAASVGIGDSPSAARPHARAGRKNLQRIGAQAVSDFKRACDVARRSRYGFRRDGYRLSRREFQAREAVRDGTRRRRQKSGQFAVLQPFPEAIRRSSGRDLHRLHKGLGRYTRLDAAAANKALIFACFSMLILAERRQPAQTNVDTSQNCRK